MPAVFSHLPYGAKIAVQIVDRGLTIVPSLHANSSRELKLQCTHLLPRLVLRGAVDLMRHIYLSTTSRELKLQCTKPMVVGNNGGCLSLIHPKAKMLYEVDWEYYLLDSTRVNWYLGRIFK